MAARRLVEKARVEPPAEESELSEFPPTGRGARPTTLLALGILLALDLLAARRVVSPAVMLLGAAGLAGALGIRRLRRNHEPSPRDQDLRAAGGRAVVAVVLGVPVVAAGCLVVLFLLAGLLLMFSSFGAFGLAPLAEGTWRGAVFLAKVFVPYLVVVFTIAAARRRWVARRPARPESVPPP